MNHLMIDIETLGITPQAPVFSIGAVLFEIETGEIVNTFRAFIDLNEAMMGRRPDGDTIKWWMEQSPEAQREMGGHQSMRMALTRLCDFSNVPIDGVWSNGSCFDIVILEDLFRQYEMDAPWKFHQIKDMRTIKFLAPECPVEREGTHHSAIDDAIYQANCVSWMYRHLCA